ncbi:hypothetical protein BDV10DRAFT_165340 [Aspergillus recurvatus]
MFSSSPKAAISVLSVGREKSAVRFFLLRGYLAMTLWSLTRSLQLVFTAAKVYRPTTACRIRIRVAYRVSPWFGGGSSGWRGMGRGGI